MKELHEIRNLIHSLDSNLSTGELVDQIKAKFPHADLETIKTAFRQVGDEKLTEARELERYKRMRKARIAGVVRGSGQ